MSEAPAPTENSKIGPDYFGYYTSAISELLLQDGNSLPSSRTIGCSKGKSVEVREKKADDYCYSGDGSFCNAIGAGLSDVTRDRLKTLLQQSVNDLTPEVDEMLDPVLSIRQLQSRLRSKTGFSSHASIASNSDRQVPSKKLKTTSSSLSSTSNPEHASPNKSRSCKEASTSKHSDLKSSDVPLSNKGRSNVVQKRCIHCRSTETFHLGNGSDGPKYLCDACGIDYRKEQTFHSGMHLGADEENGELDDDLQFLLENDGHQVEEAMKKYSAELSATLGHMELQLEELLNTVMSKCRPMTLAEKKNLKTLIQKLPSGSLDRVVEIIKRHKQAEEGSCDEVSVDLEQQDNVTLWRLYFYVKAVEKAAKLVPSRV